MRLLVGLGNPGSRYVNNRHNIGYMAVDEIVRRHGFGPWRRRFQSLISEGRIGPAKVLCMKPETFMNESGQAVGEALRFYKLEPEAVIVLHDDLDLAPGKTRVKLGGGHGGHNGLRSLDAHIGKNYWRVRMGIDHPGHKDLVHGYVLRDFPKADLPWVEKLTDAVAAEIAYLTGGDAPGFMSRVANIMNPPRPKPPRPKPPRPKAAEPEAVKDADPDTGDKSENDET